MTRVEYNAPASEREIRRNAINRAAEAAMAANDNRIERAAKLAACVFAACCLAFAAILLLVGGL